MQVNVRWTSAMSFVAETGTGHSICMDGAPEFGGRNLAPRPMEMVLVGAGGCSSFDMVKILRQRKQDLRGIELQVQAERAETIPAIFKQIHIRFIVTGRRLNKEIVRQAVFESVEKYSSVSKMLEGTVRITYDHAIVEVE